MKISNNFYIAVFGACGPSKVLVHHLMQEKMIEKGRKEEEFSGGKAIE